MRIGVKINAPKRKIEQKCDLFISIITYRYLSLSIVIYRARINSIIDTIVGKSQRVCGCSEELDS